MLFRVKFTALTLGVMAFGVLALGFGSMGNAFAKQDQVSAIGGLLPQGEQAGLEKTFALAGRTYAVVTSKVSPQEDRPWLVVGVKTGSGWQPLYAAQTMQAWQASAIVNGPVSGSRGEVTVSFIVDAATGLISNVYNLVLSGDRVTLTSVWPGLINLANVQPSPQTLKIDALNFEAMGSFQNGHWRVQYTPLHSLLATATHPVYFVMGAEEQGKNQMAVMRIVGQDHLSVQVGDTVSFVPLNALAKRHMLGALGNLGTFAGISVYSNGGGNAPLRFFQAAQIMTNTYRFTAPGVYKIAVVPPGYRGMTANDQVATLSVNVLKR